MKGMYICHVCDREFPLIVENRYTARDPGKTGVLASLSKDENKLYDSFDCPHCGCQNVIQERKHDIKSEVDCVVEAFPHDGCVGCKYEDIPTGGYPCRECKCSYVDKYKKREEENE